MLYEVFRTGSIVLLANVLGASQTICLAKPLGNKTNAEVIYEVSRLSPTKVAKIVKPTTIHKLQKILHSTSKPLSIAGGRFSQGGQIAYPNGIVIDITGLNKVVSLDLAKKQITVQTGITWADIQKVIDPYNLSVNVMQSYNDFTIGGSLSVNVHGRTLTGSLIKTVTSIKILLANGTIISASRESNSDLFNASIGGYGLIGIIIEATLQLIDNEKIERKTHLLDAKDYHQFFFSQIHNNQNVIFHNGNLYPNDYNKVLSITWYKTNKNLTNIDRLRTKGWFLKEKLEEQLLRRIPIFKDMRKKIEQNRLKKECVIYRNNEMSDSVEALEPWVRYPTTSILQEYFVPVDQLDNFMSKIKQTIRTNNIHVINVSIRYVPKDSESILSYARQDSFAFVFYINVWLSEKQLLERKWTQLLIEDALSVGGTYYLPYHLYATKDQFKKAYPGIAEFIALKSKYDPQSKFMNSLYKKYVQD